ncbi:retrotransposon protein, partial [Trifolium medium]|nr:retrotransposon protein [Trifolium medium]
MYEVSSLDHLNAKFDSISQKIDSLSIYPAATVAAVTPGCEICGTAGHVAANCQLLAEPTPD